LALQGIIISTGRYFVRATTISRLAAVECLDLGALFFVAHQPDQHTIVIKTTMTLHRAQAMALDISLRHMGLLTHTAFCRGLPDSLSEYLVIRSLGVNFTWSVLLPVLSPPLIHYLSLHDDRDASTFFCFINLPSLPLRWLILDTHLYSGA